MDDPNRRFAHSRRGLDVPGGRIPARRERSNIDRDLNEFKLAPQPDVPPLRVIYLPTVMGPGPFGTKAIGETVNSGVAPANLNTVYDAIGVQLMTVPVTAERVFEAIRTQNATDPSATMKAFSQK
jgi:CO/xanthine dehydrogenase Mo-binding subunit